MSVYQRSADGSCVGAAPVPSPLRLPGPVPFYRSYRTQPMRNKAAHSSRVTGVDALDASVYVRITELCTLGDDLVARGDYPRALQTYQEALSLIPHPLDRSEAATWILTALGETYYFAGDFSQARHSLREALRGPEAI